MEEIRVVTVIAACLICPESQHHQTVETILTHSDI